MSSYFTLITMLMLVVSPLLIPAAITVVHALGNWQKHNRFTNQAIGLQRPERCVRPHKAPCAARGWQPAQRRSRKRLIDDSQPGRYRTSVGTIRVSTLCSA